MAAKGLVDGFVAIDKGMNENVHPLLLTNNEVARAVNVDLSKGFAKTRAGFRELPLWSTTLPWNDVNGDPITKPGTETLATAIDYFQDGKFQGAAKYQFQGQDYLVVVAGQMLWRINLSTHELELYGWESSVNDIPKVNMTTPRCWFCQVESFMIVQDGVNPPFIITGRDIRRSRGAAVKGVVGTDAQLLVNTADIVDEGAVAAVDPTYDTESTRVLVKMSDMVDSLVAGDYCTVRFRDTAIVEQGVITKLDATAKTYEIKFETNRDWTKYGIRRFDNLGTDVIYHGMEQIGRLEAPEVPSGQATAYGHGRIFVVRNDRYIVAGDIFLSWRPGSVLRFTEIQYISLGGAFGVPAEMGNIVSMTFMQNAMSGTGLGSMVVFCENGVCAFAVQTPRSEWLDNDISMVLFTSSGGVGQYAVQPVNNDIMYLSWDGLRSMRHTTSTVAGSGIIFENRPLSENIKQVWAESAQWAWKYSSIAYVKNRVMFLSKATRGMKLEDVPAKINVTDEDEPREPIEETRFKAIVSMYPSTTDKSVMIYNGIWTGYDFLQLFGGNIQGQRNVLVFARDNDGLLKLATLDCVKGNDANKSTTSCRIYTGSYDFFAGIEYNSGATFGQTLKAKSILKRADYFDIWVSEVYGKATVRLYCRPVGYAGWVPCGSFDIEAITSPTVRTNAWPQFRRKQRITIPRLRCDEVTGLDLMTASDFQFCIEWEGGLQIDRAIFFATLLPEETNFACVQPQGRILSATGFDDYDYVIGGDE